MNTLKNLAKKAIAVSSGMLVLGATAGAAYAASLADYPAPFVKDGQFNGLIVVGEKAASADILGAIEISSGLQAASTTVVEGGASTTTMGGDSHKIGDSADMLEIGEFIGTVTETLTEDDLMFLKGGVISTDNGDTDFTQQISLAVDTHADSMVGLYEDNDDEVGTYFKFNDGDQLFTYELEFTSGLESDVESNQAVDIEDESLFILGQYFSVVDTNVDEDDALVQLDLISGDVTDTLREGETKTYTVDGKEYEVTLLIVSDNQNPATAKFLVNGESTDSMQEGETDKVAGLDIGVREVLANEGAEANGADLTEFYLGANKLELKDTDIATANGAGTVKVNGESIEDADLNIIAVATVDANGDGDITISKIEYTLNGDAKSGDSDVFLKKGEGLRAFLDEPQGMLADEWDIVYQGTSAPGATAISFDASGDDQYDLTFTNRRGTEYTVPFFFAGASGNADGTFGDEDDAFVFAERDNDVDGFDEPEDYFIGLDDYFVVTDIGATGAADNGDDTYLLQFNDLDESENTLTFQTGDGKEVKATYSTADPSNTLDVTSGDITIGGKDYSFEVYEPTAGVYRLAVDLDNDGFYAESAANSTDIVDIVVKGGGILTLSNESLSNGLVGSEFTATLSTQGDDVDNDVAQTATFEFTEAADEVNVAGLTSTSGTWFDESVKGEDRTLSLNGYGTTFDLTDDTDNSNSLEIMYPTEQVEALVYVTGGDVQSSTASTSGAVRVNPLGVGFSVLDSAVTDSQFAGRNLIVVGGPCVNTVAAELMANPTDCTEGFTQGKAMLKLFDNGKRVALLVAGYAAQDTQGASRVIAQSKDYTLTGMESELTVTSVNNVMVKNK